MAKEDTQNAQIAKLAAGITPENVSGTHLIDLSQPYYVGMPHHPNHPPYVFGMTKKHGDFVSSSGMSSAAESIAFSGHTGTHIDAFGHFSCGGQMLGGIDAEANQSYASGVARHSIAEVGPIFRRGILLDIARLIGVERLPEDFEITPEHLQSALEAAVGKGAKIEIQPGDVVLLRTGWGQLWHDARAYVNQVRSPGVGLAGAQWLSAKGIFATGADTLAFERVPDPNMPVHVHMLVESGIHLIENLNLERLSEALFHDESAAAPDESAAAPGTPHGGTFTFIAAPLRFEGATGSPIRPVALIS